MDRYDRARRIVADIATQHPWFNMDAVRDLLAHRELVVGLEILCDNLYEYRVSMNATMREALVELCEESGLEAHYYRLLRASEPAREVMQRIRCHEVSYRQGFVEVALAHEAYVNLEVWNFTQTRTSQASRLKQTPSWTETSSRIRNWSYHPSKPSLLRMLC